MSWKEDHTFELQQSKDIHLEPRTVPSALFSAELAGILAGYQAALGDTAFVAEAVPAPVQENMVPPPHIRSIDFEKHGIIFNKPGTKHESSGYIWTDEQKNFAIQMAKRNFERRLEQNSARMSAEDVNRAYHLLSDDAYWIKLSDEVTCNFPLPGEAEMRAVRGETASQPESGSGVGSAIALTAGAIITGVIMGFALRKLKVQPVASEQPKAVEEQQNAR
jgi:hypothetical protein